MATEWEKRFNQGDTRAETDGRRIVGYAIRFNEMSLDLGGFKEVIKPAAVDRIFDENLDVRAFANHDTSKVLGRRSANTLRLEKDRKGLRFEIDTPRTTAGKDLLESVSRGDISGASFAFRVMPDGEHWRHERGTPIREIDDMLVSEISIVSLPAYPSTEVALRSLDAFRGKAVGRSSGRTAEEAYYHLIVRQIVPGSIAGAKDRARREGRPFSVAEYLSSMPKSIADRQLRRYLSGL